MPIDASIPLSYKPIDGMANLSSLLDTQRKMLELNKSNETYDSDVAKAKAESSTAQSGAENNSIALGERKALQQLLSDPSQYTGADGKIDYNKALPLVMKVAPTTGMEHVKNFMATQEQATNSDKAINGLQAQQKNQLSNYAYSMLDKSDAQIREGFDLLGKEMPSLVPHLPHLQNSLDRARQNGGQPAVNAMISQFARSTVGTPEQQQMNTPNILGVNNGAKSFGVNTKNDVPGMRVGDVVDGTGATAQPPPTTEIMKPDGSKRLIGPSPGFAPGERPRQGTQQRTTGFNSNGGDELVGNVENVGQATPQQREESNIAVLKNELSKNITKYQRGFLTTALAESEANLAKAKAASQSQATQQQTAQGGRNYQTSLPTGQAENIKDNVDAMNTHFAKLSGPASDAQLALSLTGSIKTLARDAITGTTAGRQSYVNGLLNSFKLGNQATGDLQKDTDLLEKYLAQLNLTTPASSDAARTLISAARPHGTMKDTAIIEAADQISSVINANLDVRNHLSKWKYKNDGRGDSVGYQAEREKLEGLADPRIWQMRGKTKAEQMAFIDALKSPALASELVRKSRALHDMGVTK